jgi:hypothetical protein
MPESIANISPAALAGLIAAYLLAASRIAGPLTNLWASLPKPWAVIIPAIVAMLPQVADLFTDVNSWQSFAVSVSSAIALILPGIKPKPPEPPRGPGGDVIPPGPLTEDEPPSLPGVARFFAIGWMLVACSPAAPAKAPCDDATFEKMLKDCTAAAATCVIGGKPEEECGAICDHRADERAKQCR